MNLGWLFIAAMSSGKWALWGGRGVGYPSWARAARRYAGGLAYIDSALLERNGRQKTGTADVRTEGPFAGGLCCPTLAAAFSLEERVKDGAAGYLRSILR